MDELDELIEEFEWRASMEMQKETQDTTGRS